MDLVQQSTQYTDPLGSSSQGHTSLCLRISSGEPAHPPLESSTFLQSPYVPSTCLERVCCGCSERTFNSHGLSLAANYFAFTIWQARRWCPLGTIFDPVGTSDDVSRQFLVPQLSGGYYWHPVGRGQRGWYTPHDAPTAKDCPGPTRQQC